jgi:DHA1 family inner membrane transport protein
MQTSSKASGNTLTAMPTAVYALAACLALIGSNAFGLSALAPAIAESLGISGPAVMVAATCYGAGTALSALFLSHWIDRYGVFASLRLALATFAAALLFASAASSALLLCVSQFIAGVAVGVAVPAIYAGALEIAPRGNENRTVGFALSGWTLSLMIGVALSTLLAERMSWRSVFIINALLCIALTLAMRNMKASRRSKGLSSRLTALRIRSLHPLLIACFASMAAFYGLYSYLGDFISQVLHQSLIVSGLVTFMYGVGFGAGTFLDKAFDQLDSRKSLPRVFFAAAALYLFIAVGGDRLSVLLGMFLLLGIVNHAQVNLLVTRLTETRAESKGAILGLNTAVTYIGSLSGTALFRPIYSTYGFRMIALVSAALVFVASISSINRDHGLSTNRRLS